VLLRPLPYQDPARLVKVFTANPAIPAERGPFSPQDLDDLSRAQQVFSSVGPYWYSSASSGKTLTGNGEPMHLETAFAGAGFFETLGISPALGRTFLPAENIHGNDAVAVLSDRLWREHFHGDPLIVGTKVLLDGAPTLVAGVMPPSFVFPAPQVDVWLPLAQITDNEIPHIRQLRWIDVVARLKPGVSAPQAASSLSVIMLRLARQYPETNQDSGAAAVVDLHRTIVGDVRPILWALLAAVSLVWLMACGNLANILLARGTGRGREFAIRSALGASRSRLRKQSLTESLVLALLGGAISLAVGWWITSLLVSVSGNSIPLPAAIRMDVVVVLFGAALSLAAGWLIGIVPATRLSGRREWESLKSVGLSSTSDVQNRRNRNALIVAEGALAWTLLASSALVLQSLWKLVNTDAGFDASHVLTVQLPLPLYKFSDEDKQSAAYRQELLRRVAAVPGVTAVGGSKTLPLYGGGEPYGFTLTTPSGEAHVLPTAGAFIVTQGYFEALSIPLVSGRFFREADLVNNRPVIVISRSLAQAYWPGGDPVGSEVSMGKIKLEVIGVAGDVHNEGLDKPVGTALYLPSSLASRSKLDLFVRTSGEPISVAGAVRQAIRDLRPDQAITEIAPLQQDMEETVSQPRFFTAVLSAFGALALVLAALGIFGVISYNVRQRTREIGIRMALGASRSQVLGLVLEQAAKPLAMGAVIGLAGSLIAGRLRAGIMYGLKATDLLALLVSLAVLSTVAIIAAMIPATRATRVDPVVALRYE
jgi:putative ABC transport system permease protein